MEEKFLMKNFTIKKDGIFTLISFVLILVAWKIASLVLGAEIILPSPEKTIVSFFNLLKTREFYTIILFSIERGLIGFIISLVLGLLAGFFSGFNKVFSKIFEPVLAIIRSTPVMSVILIALIWFKSNNVPIFASFLMSFPIICTNIREGIKNIDKNLVDMAVIYKIKRKRIISEIYFPSVMPFIIAAISTSIGIGWKVIIAAEVLSQPKYAIGTSLQDSKLYLNMDQVFAWTITAILIGYLFEKIVRLIEIKTIKWKHGSETLS